MVRFAWLLVLSLMLALPLAGCKKKGTQEGEDVVAQADAKAGAEKKKKKAKKKKSKKKGKKKRKAVAEKPGEPAGADKGTGEAPPPPGKPKLHRVPAPAAPAEGSGDPAAASPEPRERPASARAAAAARDERPAAREAPPAGRELTPADAARERAARAREKAAARAPVSPPVQVSVARLFTVTQLNNVLPEKGWVSYGPVPGIEPSEYFNSLIYRKPGTNRFVSLLAWDYPQYAQALEKWNEMYATWPNTSELKDVFARFIFFSYRNQVNTLTFLEPDKAMVLALSCHVEVCDDDSLYQLAQAVHKRAQE